MRLLLFNHEFPPVGGGGGHVTAHLAKEYAERGHEVYVLTSAYKGLPRFEMRDGYQIERVPAMRADANVAQVHEMLTYAASSAWVSMWRAKRIKPDAVHVFFGIPSGGAAYLMKKLFNVPYIVFLGGRDVPRPNPDPAYYEQLYAALKPAISGIWKNASYVVACSKGLRDLALETAPKQKFEVIPDGIDLNRFTPALPRQRAKVRLLGIGRLIPRKGFDTLIRAAALLQERTATPFEVEIVGDGPEREKLTELVARLGLNDCICFAGAVAYEDLPRHYANADVFVLTSHAEGMPLVALEAMATGLPVVATNVQGMDELVKVGENGRLFSVGDHAQLADILCELLEDMSVRQHYGQASLARVQKYAWSNVADAYLNLLEAATFKP